MSFVSALVFSGILTSSKLPTYLIDCEWTKDVNESRTKGVPDSMSMRGQIRMPLTSGVTLAKLCEFSKTQSESKNDDNGLLKKCNELLLWKLT